MKKKYIAIVDPFVDSRHIVEAFNERNICCISILNDKKLSDLPDIIKINRYFSQLYDQQFFIKDNLEEVIEQLKSIELIGIITGCETGSVMTDILNQRLNLPFSNPTETSLARFDKFETNELAKRKGIPTVKQIKITAESIKNNLCNLDQFKFPVVIKPTQSAASFGVYFCKNQVEVMQAFTNLISEKDSFFGKVHNEFVIQEQLIGTEFIVDVVNFNKLHYLAAVHVYAKRIIDNRSIYQSISWINPENLDATAVQEYTNNILDAIDFNYGPAHIEVFLTAEGPRLVEVNPRVSGAQGYINKMCKIITGQDQVDLLADLYSHKHQLSKRNAKGLYSKLVCLCNLCQEAHINSSVLAKIKSVPSCNESFLYDKEKFPKTVDLHTAAGFILLANKDPEQLEHDYATIIKLQDESLFIPIII